MATTAIGTSLKAARERLGWSRETLAHESGVSWSAIAQIESGRRADVRLSSLSALARALGVTIDYLSGDATSAPPPMLDHRALLYGSDEEFVGAVAPFLRDGLERSEPALIAGTASGLELVREELGDDAERVELVEATEWYSAPAEALRRFRSFIDAQLEDGAKWVRIAGEPMWVGRSAAQVGEWARAESIINLTLAAAPVTVVCLYDTRSASADAVTAAKCTHPVCDQAGESFASSSYMDPRDFLLGSNGR